MPASPDRAKAPARVPSVPLFLIPKVIQEQIKKKGESVFSIFVERRLHHQYRFGSLAFVTGVGTAMMTKSASLIRDGSVVASILLPGVAFSSSTFFRSRRYPMVRMCSEKSCARGRPTYPRPTIQTVLFRIVRDAKKPTPGITGLFYSSSITETYIETGMSAVHTGTTLEDSREPAAGVAGVVTAVKSFVRVSSATIIFYSPPL